jgi:hypothetical protein
VRFQVVLDGSKQFRNTAKTAAANPLVGNLSKPTLDQFPPRTRCRVEVNVESELWGRVLQCEKMSDCKI